MSKREMNIEEESLSKQKGSMKIGFYPENNKSPRNTTERQEENKDKNGCTCCYKVIIALIDMKIHSFY